MDKSLDIADNTVKRRGKYGLNTGSNSVRDGFITLEIRLQVAVHSAQIRYAYFPRNIQFKG